MQHKKHTKFLLIALIAVIGISCKKQQSASDKKSQIDIGSLISNYLERYAKPKDGVITIVARTPIGANGEKQSPDMMIDAQFYENHNAATPFFAGDLKVGNLAIPFFNKSNGLPSGYNLQTAVNVDKSSLANFKAIWGTKARITLTPTTVSAIKIYSIFPTVIKKNDIDQNGFYIPSVMDLQSNINSNGNYTVSVTNASTYIGRRIRIILLAR